MIYLGWGDGAAAEIEYSLAIAHSNTYYPTAGIDVPDGAFHFLNTIAPVLKNRIPYSGGIAVVYSVRNKDFSHEDHTFFDNYTMVCGTLIQNHIPFKIVCLEYLSKNELKNIDMVILPGLAGISDAEAKLLNTKKVVTIGNNTGTRDEHWNLRKTPIIFSRKTDPGDIAARLPFYITAPANTFIEYYTNPRKKNSMYLFAAAPGEQGHIILNAEKGSFLSVNIYARDKERSKKSGKTITIDMDSKLLVLEISGRQAMTAENSE